MEIKYIFLICLLFIFTLFVGLYAYNIFSHPLIITITDIPAKVIGGLK